MSPTSMYPYNDVRGMEVIGDLNLVTYILRCRQHISSPTTVDNIDVAAKLAMLRWPSESVAGGLEIV